MAYFGEGYGPIHLDNIECSGTEHTLGQCVRPDTGIHSCWHSEDAGVICDYVEEKVQDIKTGDVPLSSKQKSEAPAVVSLHAFMLFPVVLLFFGWNFTYKISMSCPAPPTFSLFSLSPLRSTGCSRMRSSTHVRWVPAELPHSQVTVPFLKAITMSKLWGLEHWGNSCRGPIPGVRLQILEVSTSTKTWAKLWDQIFYVFPMHNASQSVTMRINALGEG